MNSKEALKELTLMINREKHINSEWNKKICDLELIIKKDLDKLEKLEKEHNKLKERYKHRAETSNDLCKAVKQYEKAFEILNDKFKFELGVSAVKEKYYYSLEFLYNNQYLAITQEEYELLNEIF